MNQTHLDKNSTNNYMSLKISISIVTTLIFGWILLSMYLCFLWAEKGYEFAVTKAVSWVSEQTEYLNSIIFSESYLVKRTMNIMNYKIKEVFKEIDSSYLHSILQQGTNAGYNLIPISRDDYSTRSIKKALAEFTSNIVNLSKLLLSALLVISIKVLMLILSLPLLLMASLVGISDGFMSRTIRTASLGRESAYLFHKLLAHFPSAISVGILIFILSPTASLTSGLLFALALLIGFWSAQVTSRFKKYI